MVDVDQGKAEGDVLERVVNALSDLILGPASDRPQLKGSLDGNTWADVNDGTGGSYTGRENFQARLQAIVADPRFAALAQAGLLNLTASAPTVSAARNDFGALAALYSLSPFTFTLQDPETNRALFDMQSVRSRCRAVGEEQRKAA